MAGFILMLLFVLTVVLIGVGGTVLWLWMIVDCATNEPSEGNDKLVWIVIILLTHGFGAIIYFLVRRPTRIEQYGR